MKLEHQGLGQETVTACKSQVLRGFAHKQVEGSEEEIPDLLLRAKDEYEAYWEHYISVKEELVEKILQAINFSSRPNLHVCSYSLAYSPGALPLLGGDISAHIVCIDAMLIAFAWILPPRSYSGFLSDSLVVDFAG